jgi:hypothetical protein
MKDNYVYCGFNCSKCPIYLSTLENDNNNFIKTLINCNMKFNPDNINNYKCLGCNSNKYINEYCRHCYIKSCCIKKEIENCGFCDKYPCEYIIKYLSDDSKKYLDTIHNNIFNK